MSYLVLARKYRPTTFSEVVGQEHVTRTLGNAFAAGRVHHAFLFCGPRGCGKTTLARIVGKALNCENGPATGTAEPCGKCSACTSIANGSAVDYIEMDGASNRGIDAIRELTDAVRYQPAVLRKKVYVIDEVHMLTTEAFNALLKTLEEPPPHVTFVLATTEPHKLPNTILSRCQRYDFKLVPASRLAQHLASIFKQEKLKIDAGAISLIVRESGGSVRDALSLCDQIISYVGDAKIEEKHVAEVLGVADRSLTRTLVKALATGDAGTALGAVESAIERGVDEVQLARAIVRYLRDLAVLQVAPQRAELVDASDEERGELVAESQSIDRTRVTQMFERMLRCCDELGKTLQPRLVLDCALIDVATIEPLVPLGDLIERLGELEGRIARAGGARTAASLGSSSGGGSAGGGPGGGGPGGGSGGGGARPPAAASKPAPASKPTAKADGPRADGSRADGPRADGSRADGPRADGSRADGPRADGRADGPRADGSRADGPRADGRAEPAAPRFEAVPIAHDASANGQSTKSAPVSMQPSGPVPKPMASEHSAAGSGPHIPVPTNAAEALKAWAQVIDYLESQRKISLRGYFEFARVLKWTASDVELGFADDHDSRWAGENAAEKQNLDEIKAILEQLGHKVRVSVRMLDAAETKALPTRSLVESTREKSTAERSKREAEAREHPITKHVLQTFGAQIKEIKTDV